MKQVRTVSFTVYYDDGSRVVMGVDRVHGFSHFKSIDCAIRYRLEQAKDDILQEFHFDGSQEVDDGG